MNSLGNQLIFHCHARDNQSHPRPKGFALVPGPTPLALVTDRQDHSHITTTQPLRHTASSRVPTTQPRTPQDLARMNTSTHDQPHYQPCSPRLAPQYSPSGNLTKVPSIVTSLYLVPFHLCTLLFSSRLTIVPFLRCTLVFTFYV